MTREIKFRAWSFKEKCWEGAFSIHKNGYFRNSDIEPIWQSADEANVVVMQFTGMKDRQGKEIYEGDILRMDNATAQVVFWERPPEFGLDFSHNEDLWCEDWNITDDSDRMEVIGNIYENPDLVAKEAP